VKKQIRKLFFISNNSVYSVCNILDVLSVGRMHFSHEKVTLHIVPLLFRSKLMSKEYEKPMADLEDYAERSHRQKSNLSK
jgi:hypothetical protein